MKLYHFSSKLPATGGTVDPKKLGANSWSVAEKRALSTPRSFFYTHPKHREALFTTASPLFEADVADDKIYDFDKDEHAIKQPGTTLSHMIAKVRRKGYHGVMYFNGKVVAMFTPVRVRPSKTKLARVTRHAFAWITPTGDVHHVPNLHLHVDVAKKHGFKDIMHAQQNGWLRVAPGAEGTLDGLNHVTPPNAKQLRALKDLAVKHGYDQASVNDRALRLARSLVYVSPSQREGSTMAEATAFFASPEHDALNKEAARLGGHPVPAMGVWSDGAEESTVVKVPPERAKVVAALLGKKFRQKAVGLFTPGAGSDSLHLVLLKGHTPESATKALAAQGIQYSTVIPTKTGVVAHLIGAPDEAVAALGAPSRKVMGTAEFPGADTRDEAMRVYDEMLQLARELPEPSGNIRTPGNSYKATFDSGDNTYTASMTEDPSGIDSGSKISHMFDFRQHDTPDEYGVTGAGNAMQTFSHVAAHFIHALRTIRPKGVYFSAEEPSRIKLYDALVKRLPKYAPEYVARPSTVRGGWFVEPKETGETEVQLARGDWTPLSENVPKFPRQKKDAKYTRTIQVPIGRLKMTETGQHGPTVDEYEKEFTHAPEQFPAIVVDRGLNIQDGHHRYLAAKKNGQTHVPVKIQLARPQPFSETTKALLPNAGDPVTRAVLADHLEELGDPLHHVFRGPEKPYGHTRGRQVFSGRTNGMYFSLYRIPKDLKNIAVSVNHGSSEVGESQWTHAHVPVEIAKDIIRHHFGNTVAADTTATAREMRAKMGHDYSSYKKTKTQQARETLALARTKAPSGGMIVNNQFYTGGRFLPLVFRSIKKVREAKRAKVSLARKYYPDAEGSAELWNNLGDENARGVLADYLEERGDSLHHVLRGEPVERGVSQGPVYPLNIKHPHLGMIHISKPKVEGQPFTIAIRGKTTWGHVHEAVVNADQVKQIIKEHHVADRTKYNGSSRPLYSINEEGIRGITKLARPSEPSEIEKLLWPHIGDENARGVLADHLEERGDPLYHVLRGKPVTKDHSYADFFGRMADRPVVVRMDTDGIVVLTSGKAKHAAKVSVATVKDILRHHYGNMVKGFKSDRSVRSQPRYDGVPSDKAFSTKDAREILRTPE